VARILGLTSLFDKKSTSRDNIHIIGELANAASDLDGVIKDMGKIIEAQKISEIPKEEIEFKPFVKNIIERLISKQTQHIKWKINSNTDRITTIKPYLDNILTNIISNSIKYQSPIRKPWIDIQLRAKEEEHCIIVKDNGMGFDQKKLDSKLFVPFQRFNIDKPGKGLGLYLIKTHVEAMNGTVQIESQVNNGTKVTVQLPVNQLNN
jgi:signal transduction histidine kinase